MTPFALALQRAPRRLAARLAELEAREALDDAGWREYRETAVALATLVASAAERSDVVTTQQLADRLGISARTVRRRRKSGELKPALQLGKRVLRWRGDGRSA
jgi:methylphosphotriester-DNA--protein-cysteine methyltransferase